MSEDDRAYAEEVAREIERCLPSWDAKLAERVSVRSEITPDPVVVVEYRRASGEPAGTLELPVFFPGNARDEPLSPNEAAGDMLPDVIHAASDHRA